MVVHPRYHQAMGKLSLQKMHPASKDLCSILESQFYKIFLPKELSKICHEEVLQSFKSNDNHYSIAVPFDSSAQHNQL